MNPRSQVVLLALASTALAWPAWAREPDRPEPAAASPAEAATGPAAAAAEGEAEASPEGEPAEPERAPGEAPGTGPAPGQVAPVGGAEPPATTATGSAATTAAGQPGAAGSRQPPGWAPPRYPPPPGGTTAAPPPAVPSPDAEEASEPAPLILGHWFGVELGLRTMVIAHEGFEPYAAGEANMLGQLALAFTFAPLEFGPVSLGIVPEYDIGHRAEQTRGQDASLAVHRLAAGVVADVAIIRHLHLYARFAPGAYYLDGTIADQALDRRLAADNWTWGIDATAGLAVLLGAAGPRDDPAVGFWVRGEMGYGFAGEADMEYAPADDDDDRTVGTVHLPPVSPSGVVGRLSFGVSF